MSNAYAIAGVTVALKAVLNEAVGAPDVDTALGGTPGVSALPPDRVNPGQGADPHQLNLFLYAVSPNPGWGGVQMPARDAEGNRINRPPLALDLHYLLTAYSPTDLGAEILLGLGMQAFHEVPFFTRGRLRDVLKAKANEIPKAIETTGLPEQLEQLKITPKFLNFDEMSKIWMSLQAHYRPTAAYTVSVVLIQSERPTRPALPVLDRQIQVVTLGAMEIDDAVNAMKETDPLIAGSILRLRGRGLGGDGIQVLVGGIDLTAGILATADDHMDIQIPTPFSPGLRAGRTTAQVVRTTPGTSVLSSNTVLFSLRPSIVTTALSAGTVVATIAPAVTPSQRVFLLLNERHPPSTRSGNAYRIAGPLNNGITLPAKETNQISFPLNEVVSATYVVRIEVDGAESLIQLDGTGAFDAPNLVIP